MDLFKSKRGINMDGSNDPYFRYKMPAIDVKHEGKGKMKKSILVNVKDVCESIGRPVDYLMTYLGQKLGATAKVEKDMTLSYVTGHHGRDDVQDAILNFIQDAVMCHECRNPETSCHSEGQKKRQVLFLQCKGCGKRSDFDTTDRFVKYMMSHQANDAGYGHAGQAPSNVTAADHLEPASKGKAECPNCHHKTSKSTCGKCGNALDNDATASDQKTPAVLESATRPKKNQCPKCNHKTSKPVCSKCDTLIVEKVDFGQDQSCETNLQNSTAKQECEEPDEEDSSPSSPLEQLGGLIQDVVEKVCNQIQVFETNLQPVKVSEKAEPVIAKSRDVIEQLYKFVGDPAASIDVVIAKVQEGVSRSMVEGSSSADVVFVGLLLGLRDIDIISESLLEGCLRLQLDSPAMQKFVEFLKTQEEDDEEDDADSADGQED